MIRLIACDLDETLLDDKKRIPQYNLEKIKQAKDQGVLFVPASGRGYTSMDSVLTSLAAYDKEQEYTISNNGGIVVENKGFRHISFHSFTFEQAKALFAYGIQKDICIEVFTDHDVYAFHLNEDERSWLFMFKSDAVECKEDSIDFLTCLNKKSPTSKVRDELCSTPLNKYPMMCYSIVSRNNKGG